MNPILDEVLFYGGVAFSALAVLAAAIYLCVYKAGMKRLIAKLETEYGKKERKPASKSAAGKRGV